MISYSEDFTDFFCNDLMQVIDCFASDHYAIDAKNESDESRRKQQTWNCQTRSKKNLLT